MSLDSDASEKEQDTSARPTIGEISVSATELAKVGDDALKSELAINAVQKSGQKTIRRQFVLSLVRHGQSAANITSIVRGTTRCLDAKVELTSFGEQQVEKLKVEWEGTHTDLKISSPYRRAELTAAAIPDPEDGRRFEKFEQIIGRNVYEQFHGIDRCNDGSRDGKGRNGESLEDVAYRAELVMRQIAIFFEYQHNLKLESESLDALSSEQEETFDLGPLVLADCNVDPINVHTSKGPKDLPVELLHIVVVSHNIFLSELYELIHRWQTPANYVTSDISFDCTGWSRHLITMEIPVVDALGQREFLVRIFEGDSKFQAGGPGALLVKDLNKPRRFVHYH